MFHPRDAPRSRTGAGPEPGVPHNQPLSPPVGGMALDLSAA